MVEKRDSYLFTSFLFSGFSPCDFGLFPKIKIALKGKCFDIISSIVTEQLKAHPKKKVFQKCFETWNQSWDKCFATQEILWRKLTLMWCKRSTLSAILLFAAFFFIISCIIPKDVPIHILMCTHYWHNILHIRVLMRLKYNIQRLEEINEWEVLNYYETMLIWWFETKHSIFWHGFQYSEPK